MDVGTGDGRWPYEMALRDPDSLYIGLDPDGEALKKYAFRASRRPEKGGAPNVAFAVASVEGLPGQLVRIADEVHVIFPWAALLRGLLRPEDAVVRGLALLAKPGASLEMVLTYDAGHDRGAGLDAGTPTLDEGFIAGLRKPYLLAGLRIAETRRLTAMEALAIPSTWGRRLLHGRPREVFLVTARSSAG